MTTIDFLLDGEPGPTAVFYRPWGVRALKLRVRHEGKKDALNTAVLRIRPHAIQPNDLEAGIFRAQADDSSAFVISWGGGHEPGPCLKATDYLLAFERCALLPPGETSVIYFNLDHIGPELPETAVVTIEAYDEESGAVLATLPITLQKPPDYHPSAVCFTSPTAHTWQPQGTQVAHYEPRWWPRATITYAPLPPYPLQLRVQDNRLLVEWQGTLVAQITDHTKPSILQPDTMRFELFDFDPYHLALRLWFFWLDKRIGGSHEVPDAERFDLLLRKQDGYVTLACTDMHWREMWGQIDGTPMRATLGLSATAKLKILTQGLAKVSAIFKGQKDKDHEGVYSPVDGPSPVIPQRAQQLGQGEFVKRAKGLEAHLPVLENVLAPKSEATARKLTSSDVRLG